MSLLLTLGVVIAVAAAARSTWSPCGLSMLSTITPVTERGRDRNYWATVPWYLIGALAGGLTLGGLAALIAIPVGMADLAPEVTLTIAGLFTVVSVFSDLGVGGFQLPRHKRQVERFWLDNYRAWVYGTGFGWQIGVGLATYIVTTAVYVTVLIAILTGSPSEALHAWPRLRRGSRAWRSSSASERPASKTCIRCTIVSPGSSRRPDR